MKDFNNIAILGIGITGFAASWLGVALFRRWSLARNLLDIPNERSSHTTPIPRGGGLVIVLVCLVGYALVAVFFPGRLSWGYLTGGLLVAAVSWLDDLYSIAFWKRLIVHFVAAAFLIADLGAWQLVGLPFTSAEVGLGPFVGSVLTAGWIVWLLNAYNFMDGIDGIAAMQAVASGIGWSVLAFLFGWESLLAFAGLFSAASLGFLIHNWPPAKIFMGDVGSAFLGFTLAAMPFLGRAEAGSDLSILPLIAIGSVWFFVFDTVFTFVRRAIGKERVWEAHRGHLYQRMVIAGRSHLSVTLQYGISAVAVIVFSLLAVIFGGSFVALAVFLLVVFTALQIYAGIGKKH